jgi:hypothetical protein
MMALLCLAAVFTATVITTTIAFSGSTPTALEITNDTVWNVSTDINPMGDPVEGGGVPH